MKHLYPTTKFYFVLFLSLLLIPEISAQESNVLINSYAQYCLGDIFDITGNPNLFDSKFNNNLTLETSNQANIQIYSSIGTLAYSKIHEINQGKIYINPSSLSNGMYLLSVKTEEA